MNLTINQIISFTHGTAITCQTLADSAVTSFTWDSREVTLGGLFVALPGERVDGHDYITNAIERGAYAILLQRDVDEEVIQCAEDNNVVLIRVESTMDALGDLARGWRMCLHAIIVGVTGSCGKTSTKNFIRDVLGAQFKTVATLANQNNEIGAPRTLLSADIDTQAIIVEMGMRGLGQITHLASIARPDWGIITNVGTSHMELLGTRDNIARAKAELLEALPDTGVAFVNADDDYAEFVIRESRLNQRGVEVCLYGNTASPEDARFAETNVVLRVWAEEVEQDEWSCPQFVLKAWMSGQTIEAPCHLHAMGLHNVNNACGAAAIGLKMGMKIETIARALENAQLESGRQEIVKASHNITIINDSYNANPDSMKAALATLAAYKAPGRRVAILGDMGELGINEIEAHEEIGRICAHTPLDLLLCVGTLSEAMKNTAIAEGMDEKKVLHAPDAVCVKEMISDIAKENDVILIKASHFMNMGSIVEGLK